MTSLHADVADDILLRCDRTRSKEARYALDRLLWKPLNLLEILLSADCIAAPHNDILRAQESNKLPVQDSLWQCVLCQKLFRSEHVLDKHLARKHPNVRYDSGTTCLADLCGVLTPCLPLTNRPLPSISSVSLTFQDEGVAPDEEIVKRADICNDLTLRKRRVESCVEVYRACLIHDAYIRRGGTSMGALKRIRRDLCEQAIAVECVPREVARNVVGAPDRVLRPTANRCISYHSLVAVIILMLAVLLSKWCFLGEKSPTNLNKGNGRGRRRKRGSGKNM